MHISSVNMEVTSATTPTMPSNGMSTPPFATIEPERVVEHLASICEIALGASRKALEQPGNLLHEARYAETVARCTRFANDAQNVLYIQKDIAGASNTDGGSDGQCKLPGECLAPTVLGVSRVYLFPIVG